MKWNEAKNFKNKHLQDLHELDLATHPLIVYDGNRYQHFTNKSKPKQEMVVKPATQVARYWHDSIFFTKRVVLVFKTFCFAEKLVRLYANE